MICYPCSTNNHDDCRGPDCDCDCQSLSPHGKEQMARGAVAVAEMGKSALQKILDFERGLEIGSNVEVRWTAGSGGHYRAAGQVVKINPKSLRVKIDHIVKTPYGAAYQPGHVIVVPRVLTDRWAQFNGVFQKGES